MKIIPIAPQNSIDKLKRTGNAYSKPDAYVRGNDEVQLSEEAQSFASVYKAVQGEISAPGQAYYDKVADIAQRIQDGTYSVKSEDVAQKIMEDLF